MAISTSERRRGGWSERPLRSMADYTLSRAPLALQARFQPLFRVAMQARLASLTRGAQPFARVVDLGCGVGDWTLGYLAMAARVAGVDINERFLAEARRAAEQHPRGRDAVFVHGDLAGYDDLAGADLVCLGASLMYVDDADVRGVLRRLAAAQRAGAWLYVRASVVTPLRAPFATDAGYYRARGLYERFFAEAGYALRDRAYSAAVVAAHLAHRVAPRGALAPVARAVAAGAHLERALRRENDYCNWVLQRG